MHSPVGSEDFKANHHTGHQEDAAETSMPQPAVHGQLLEECVPSFPGAIDVGSPPTIDTAPNQGTSTVDAQDVEDRHSAIRSLARTLSHRYSDVSTGGPFLAPEGSPLNPNSNNFDSRTWAKAVVGMMNKNGDEFCTAGVCFQNLGVYGFGGGTDYQKTVSSIPLDALGYLGSLLGIGKANRISILQGFDGFLNSGEMLVVLGPPGSGCTTFLKTIAGETNGIHVDEGSYLNYQGLTAKEMFKHHRGEVIYTAETDVHFPQITVGDTLTFAARARAPRQLPPGIDKNSYANHMRDVVMAMFGISHTVNTQVGNDFVRGVSGGERKRVSIAEAALANAPLQCWDNSTRGLDSANAIEFCRTLRLQADIFNTTACVSIYQAPQNAYNLFDKVLVLYEGRQIYFGRVENAQQYFVDLGFECPARATTPDFLTAMTSPQERIVRPGFENRVPRTPDEFAATWKESAEYHQLQAEIANYKNAHPLDGPDAVIFRAIKAKHQAKLQRLRSPFTLSYIQQVELCFWRGWKRLIGDPSLIIGALIGNGILALIVGSVFFNLKPNSSSFFLRSAVLFFACLQNAFAGALEILTLYAQRPIIEKHARYAFYHPSAEAISSMICDLPYKIGNLLVYNIVVYFMANLRRDAGSFFFYLLVSFITVTSMSMIFRTIASTTRSLSQAMVPAAIFIVGSTIFTGFALPFDYMPGWCRWLSYVNVLAYSLESIMVNEYHGQKYPCANFIPPLTPTGDGLYDHVGPFNRVCSSVGAEPGVDYVLGDNYIGNAFRFYHSHKWRNVGIICVFTLFFLVTYLITAELVAEKKSKGEILVFRRGCKPPQCQHHEKNQQGDLEALSSSKHVPSIALHASKSSNAKDDAHAHTSTFHWSNICYDIDLKGKTKRILDNVDGWVKPGTLTALMGVSGAGKTSLLDCLADRVSVGVITGEMLVDGHPRDASFQRKTGYAQQQDLHLATSTVREALNFSALLRQPAHVSRADKLAYVEQVIQILGMDEYADSVVGVPGEGLNVEQRKRLTIGVELAARPPLLLFVDEPTSGLDSQTSWAILDLLEKLTEAGQAILCTIHQPSAMLFQRFDRLLFLAKGGQTVYFGDIGGNSSTVISYFERNGVSRCPPDANPAEWMLEVIGAAPGSQTDIDWQKTWISSPEFRAVKDELTRLQTLPAPLPAHMNDPTSYREFAATFSAQLREVVLRVFEQYWRTPSYIYSKFALCTIISLFIGFVFYRAPNTIQGLTSQMFAIFNIFIVFGQLVQQVLPHFIMQRALYEARERPSKTYHWKVFMLGQIIVELPWNTLMSVIIFLCWYYPVGLHHNAAAANQVVERGGLMFLMIFSLLIFTSTFGDMIVAAFETEEAAGNLANLLYMLCLIFCGVLAAPRSLPGFWIFMYRVNPFSYLVSALLSIGVANTDVVCSAVEYLHFEPPHGSTCAQYLDPYVSDAGGYLRFPDATDNCEFCPVSSTNTFLASVNVSYADRWKNFGIVWVYIVFNVLTALGLYWLARVPKRSTSIFRRRKNQN